MFGTVLIANRGEIAVRIARTLRELGIRSLGVFAESDADSLHVEAVDACFPLGPGGARDTYLDQARLLELMAAEGVDAVHPGYGFLSENAEFAQRVEAGGARFIGPTPEQIRTFGLKHVAREVARRAGVPLAPGSPLLSDAGEAVAAAREIGFPVMLKSTAGGGGIGMRVCRDVSELEQSFDLVRGLAQSSFASGELFVERFVERPRHIEVQIFGDGRGGVIVAGDRDCSLQRRNQKVVEECPAPGLDGRVRAAIHEYSRALAAAVDYRSAGTVEFLFDVESEEVYFLEVNTRLQVEHGVTEEVFGIDLVRWMVELAAGAHDPQRARLPDPRGHAVEARLYAEDPAREFRPTAGFLQLARFPAREGVRVDAGVRAGAQVSAFFDPLLAKLVAHAETRERALQELDAALAEVELYGFETNVDYLRAAIADPDFRRGAPDTGLLGRLDFAPRTAEVLAAGHDIAVQACPGRAGYWRVGVPPSGPMDDLSFRLGNELLGNAPDAAGLELSAGGLSLRFDVDADLVVTGASVEVRAGGRSAACWEVTRVAAGETLEIGDVEGAGMRSYLLVRGGFQVPESLGSRATFALGRLGGHGGRKLAAGDVLRLAPDSTGAGGAVPPERRPTLTGEWTLEVVSGPHGAPDFFTESDIDAFFEADWRVHYNSSRTGIRLIGPRPEWAREDGGEAGLHPSNIHDNAYAFGAVDYTGDMPVILGPDGPSLGGFVCPAAVADSERWKLGQMKPGDRVKFRLRGPRSPVRRADRERQVTYRTAGENFLLVEFGDPVLDIRLRFRAHALMRQLERQKLDGVRELTPGIRSLQVHYDRARLAESRLIDALDELLVDESETRVPSRIVHLPLAWDDPVCREAAERYQRSVREDAPWCPDNIEFIRRINGLESRDEVRRISFDARYLVLGLGDVYLGAPVATPLDPRHRLVTTKYNPARTWTAENSVGIGGAYLCVYGMEGPGGYQLFGRTLQVWNRYRRTASFTEPWLLRFFDQIRFHPVSSAELGEMRAAFPRGGYEIEIESTEFDLADYEAGLRRDAASIDTFARSRERAFAAELEYWREAGLDQFDGEAASASPEPAEHALPDGAKPVTCPVTGSVWSVDVQAGQRVGADEALLVVESMKTEFPVRAPSDGRVAAIFVREGQLVQAGQTVAALLP